VPLIDTTLASFTRRGRVLSLSTARLSAGQHRLLLTVSDYQETKNNENVGPVLPNTRTFTATFLVR
jgi:hypothetical protein